MQATPMISCLPGQSRPSPAGELLVFVVGLWLLCVVLSVITDTVVFLAPFVVLLSVVFDVWLFIGTVVIDMTSIAE